jgi:8-oxo-dGTP pyrophosphatase MutT (NUDIX family)
MISPCSLPPVAPPAVYPRTVAEQSEYMTTVVRLFPDSADSPIWFAIGPVDYEDVRLTDSLEADLRAWEAAFYRDYEFTKGWKSDAAAASYFESGLALAERLADEFGTTFEVEFIAEDPYRGKHRFRSPVAATNAAAADAMRARSDDELAWSAEMSELQAQGHTLRLVASNTGAVYQPPTRDSAFAQELQAVRPATRAERSLKRDYLKFIKKNGEASLDRDGGREHLTASCFVFTPDLENVLLCFHKKGQFWVQFGGHIEAADDSVAAAALREATEESGIDGIQLIWSSPVDLDRHALGDGFVDCDVHWDVGVAALLDGAAVPMASDESEAVRWWPVAELPAQTPPNFGERVERMRAAILQATGDGGERPQHHRRN